MRGQARIILRLLSQYRLFNEERAVRLQFADQRLCHGHADTAVEIQAELDISAEHRADFGHLGHARIDGAAAVQQPHFLTAIHLERVVTQRNTLTDLLDDV